jgi:hypothetical protein
MTHKALRFGGWAALVVGTLAALSAAIVLVTGILALTGKVTYPVDARLGPFSVHHEMSMPVELHETVCPSASVYEQTKPSDCLRFFVHDGAGAKVVRVQDADVRPTSASSRDRWRGTPSG